MHFMESPILRHEKAKVVVLVIDCFMGKITCLFSFIQQKVHIFRPNGHIIYILLLFPWKILFQKKFNLLVPFKTMKSNFFEGIWTSCNILSKAELSSRTRSSKQTYETAITHNSAKNLDHMMPQWASVLCSSWDVHASGRKAWVQLIVKTLKPRENFSCRSHWPELSCKPVEGEL